MYEKVCRRINFTFLTDGFEYTKHVINVTFEYTVKEYNKYYGGLYVRNGWHPADVTLQNGVCWDDGTLVAIQCGEPVPMSDGVLPKWFVYENGCYACRGNIPVLLNRAELREELYQNGFVCDGIRYVRYKRSSGSSRIGKCLFINEALYPRMHKWELCGLKIRDGDAIDLASYEAYVSLTLSSIIDTVEINPENILLIDDYESTFQDRCVAVTCEDGSMRATIRDVDIGNSIWDGQSLLDTSVFQPYGKHGMMLLRNRFFKSCCFNTNIQQFFSDYGITSVDQLNGFTLAERIEDIKLITTPSSVKYLKFGTMQQWLANLDPMFGLVKHEHQTHFFDGRMVRCHYQLLNSLQMSQQEVDEFMRPSLDYLTMMKDDPCVFRYYIKYPAYTPDDMPAVGLNTKNDIVYNMLGVNDRFADTKLYYSFREETTKAYTKDLRHGHVLVEGNYSVLFGNPMEMLLASIGAFDGTSLLGVGNVHSKRFKYNRKILGSRSPHVCSGNVLVANNVASTSLDHYFNLTKEILCVNSIGENLLERLSGSD